VSLENAVEKIIQEAMRRGEFDNLPGKGRPLNLDPYFAVPEDIRLTYAVLKNSGFLPEELHLLGEINDLKAQLAAGPDEEQRARLRKTLNEKTLKFNLLAESYKKRRNSPV
jgi:hypothetical protein